MSRKPSLRASTFPRDPRARRLRRAAEQSHHVAHVLRLVAGDPVDRIRRPRAQYAATIERISKAGVPLTLGEPMASDRESPLDVTLAQGHSAGEHGLHVQKAVELGVRTIQPLAAERQRGAATPGKGLEASRTGRRGGRRVRAERPQSRCRRCCLAPLTTWLGAVPRARCF